MRGCEIRAVAKDNNTTSEPVAGWLADPKDGCIRCREEGLCHHAYTRAMPAPLVRLKAAPRPSPQDHRGLVPLELILVGLLLVRLVGLVQVGDLGGPLSGQLRLEIGFRHCHSSRDEVREPDVAQLLLVADLGVRAVRLFEDREDPLLRFVDPLAECLAMFVNIFWLYGIHIPTICARFANKLHTYSHYMESIFPLYGIHIPTIWNIKMELWEGTLRACCSLTNVQ